MNQLGETALRYLDEAARFSTTEVGVTRFFCTDEHHALAQWLRMRMEEAGLACTLDHAGNLIGRREGPSPDSPTLILGSHQDSVRQGGKYDGMLGIILPIVCLADLAANGRALPYAVEVIAFGDEEGGRFSSTLVGSRAVAGRFDAKMLAATDATGMSMEAAMRAFGLAPDRIGEVARDPTKTIGFLEVHIEQGPVLESEGLPVGIVTAITGIERHQIRLLGRAGHAGTTPMAVRRDALAAASELVLFVERLCRESQRLVGVVGQLKIEPGSVNVIPASCDLTVELRSPDRDVRSRGRAAMYRELERIGTTRGVTAETTQTYEAEGIACSSRLSAELETAVKRCGLRPKRLFSGAGHDGLAMNDLTEVGMLFVRCRDGLSHHPDEAITAADADAAAQVLIVFLESFVP